MQVRSDDGCHVRIDDRRRHTFVLPELGEHVRRDRDVCVELVAQNPRRLAFVLRVGVRVQETDTDAVDTLEREAAQLPFLDAFFDSVDRRPFSYLVTPFGSHQRRSAFGAQVVEFLACLPSYLYDVAESLGRYHRRLRPVAFQKSINTYGIGVYHFLGIRWFDAGAVAYLLYTPNHPGALVFRRGCLRGDESVFRRQCDVGEGASDVHAYAHTVG